MGLIINKSIQKMLIGYSTSDFGRNVKGGVLGGSTAVKFGDLVAVSSTTGFYEAVTSTNAATAKVAGVVLATNVKIDGRYPHATEDTTVNVGEAFNLMTEGYVAVKVYSTADTLTTVKAAITEGATVYLSVNGITPTASGNTALNAVFTGEYEMHGATLVAEILLK